MNRSCRPDAPSRQGRVARLTPAFVVLAIAGCSDAAQQPPSADAATIARAQPDVRDMPLWAYGVVAPPRSGDAAKPQAAPGPSFDPSIPRAEQLEPLRVDGSSRTYTRIELNDWQHVADWFPEQHAPVPRVIEHGPDSLGAQTRACGFCHRVTGGGRPENASVFGLPVAYFLRQLDDFRNGRRRSSDPRKPNVPTMIALARAISDHEARAAAEFWSAQDGGPHIRVVETDFAPPAGLHGNLFVATGSERTEALSARILEVPEDLGLSGGLDDPRSGFVAYVPGGSVARGRALATTGAAADAADGAAAATLACITCHGPDLRGLGDAPPIAGRSPSYLVRQLYDFRSGTRDGSMAASMKPVVARLSATQMTDLAAFIATLPRSAADAAAESAPP